MTDVWAFLTDENNRAALALIGGAVAAVCGAAWAVYTRIGAKAAKATPPAVKADRGGVAIGGDATGAKISTGGEKGGR